MESEIPSIDQDGRARYFILVIVPTGRFAVLVKAEGQNRDLGAGPGDHIDRIMYGSILSTRLRLEE